MASAAQLDLIRTLSGGQSFRWMQEQGVWYGVVAKKAFALRSLDNVVSFRADSDNIEATTAQLRDYFRLGDSLEELSETWSAVCPRFHRCRQQLPSGVRLLRQDPTETLFAFICSSNNNVSRISRMMNALCERFGTSVVCVDGPVLYTFPAIERLAQDDVADILRNLGFGYRAKYVHETARLLWNEHAQGAEAFLSRLRLMCYPEARQHLLKFSGVGPKVADCIVLLLVCL